MNTFGSRIKKLREENQLTQVDLANKLNITHQSVSKWERNESTPEVSIIIELSRIFSVSTDYILLGIDDTRWYLDVRVDKNRPITPLEDLSEEELMALFTLLIPDMSDEMKISLNNKGYLDLHYSYMWSEGKEIIERFWYECTKKMISVANSADNFVEIFEEVRQHFRLPKILLKKIFDELVSIGKIANVSHLIDD